MPADLLKAHQRLDAAVDKAYRATKLIEWRKDFSTERNRVEFLFALYEKLTASLLADMAKRPKRRRE